MIRSCLLFEGMENAEISTALEQLKPRKKECKKGEILFQTGDCMKEIGIVLYGSIHIIKEDIHGNETILAHVVPGEFFGETFAFSQTPITVSVRAGEACTVMFLDCARILTESVPISANLLKAFAGKNLFLTERITHLSQRTLREKVMSYLKGQSLVQGSHSVEIPFDRQQMADYLAADRSALSAVLGKLQKEGIIRFHKNYFTLL